MTSSSQHSPDAADSPAETAEKTAAKTADGRPLTPAAQRALAEAAERRAAAEKAAAEAAKVAEEGGPKGLEPTRYGDWERKGIAVDF